MRKVKQLIIYPVKSMAGIEMKDIYTEKRGFKYDRRWVLVNKNNVFITQREHIILTKCRPYFDGESVMLQLPSGESVNLSEGEYERSELIKVWGDTVKVKIATDKISTLISEEIGIEVRLCKLKEESRRSLSKNEGIVSFADRWPYLILGTRSIDDFNTRLKNPVKYQNFRPNIIVESFEPYEEDFWESFSIGDVKFQGKGTCGRCVMINNDQKTGEVDREVLNTLGSYRKIGNKVPMGLQAVSQNEGRVSIGDTIILKDSV